MTKEFTLSRLFIYYNERVMEGTVREDASAMIHDGIKTLVKQGAAPETAWPYVISNSPANRRRNATTQGC